MNLIKKMILITKITIGHSFIKNKIISPKTDAPSLKALNNLDPKFGVYGSEGIE